MLTALYRSFWHLAPPLIRRYLRRRARSQSAYLQHWNERFGEAYPDPVQQAVWIHAVSVGETRAAAPLIEQLRRRFPDAPLLITQMTPTGRATAQALYPDAQCRYLPYDHPDYVARFLAEHRPRFGVLMETEIWPNLMNACRDAGIPLFLANARLSAQSQRGYQRIRSLIAPALAALSGCYAQTEADAGRLHLIGAPHPEVCGNTKYDIMPSETQTALGRQWRQQAGRPVIVCGSTRVHRGRDEAALLLEAWRAYRGDALLVVIPRHPERFDDCVQTALSLGFRVQRRSSGEALKPDTQVWIGDSMGEMAAYYAMADIAFVGGSLVDTGCQNPIEPLAAGVPVLFGPSTYHFADTCAQALAAGAARQTADAADWYAAVCRWLDYPDERRAAAAQSHAFIRAHQGAALKTANLIARTLAQGR